MTIMMMLKRLTAAMAFAAVALAIIAAGAASAMAQGQQNGGPPAPGGTQAANGPAPGEAVVSWQAVASATHYRVGWVAYDDYKAATAAGQDWLETFAFVDLANRGQSTHKVARLTPGINYAFIVGSNDSRYGAPTWSAWATLTLSAAPGTTSCPTTPAPTPDNGATPTPTPAANVDYDTDDDGLIEIASLAQLDVIRHDLDGDGVSTHADHAAAFPNALDGMGCLPPNPCNGYELTADLDFDTNGSGRPDPGDAYWDGGHGWLPIGDPETEFRYNTVFDGGGHTIANLFIYWPESSHAGLFRATGADAEIRNVRLTGVRVIGQNWVGALVGSNSGLIARSSADGQVSGKGRIGGLAGYNSGSISNSKAVVVVEGSGAWIGGLVGSNAGTIADSSARGSVTGEGDYVGGLAGSGATRAGTRNICGAISGSHATGAVAGEGDSVGGLVGNSGCGTISGSYATGNVTGEGGYVGGLAGQTSGTITASYATGDVAGESDNVGGLAGHAAGAITASYATGDVAGESDNVGGLAGHSSGAITASYATGDVAGESDNVGGLVGIGGSETTKAYRSHSGSHILTITASYATGNVSGDENVGGLVGSAHHYWYRFYCRLGSCSSYHSAVKNTGSYATGKVSGQANVGGLVGGGQYRAGGLHSYWDTQTSGVSRSNGGAGKTTRELQAPTGSTGIYSRWNADWWDFGTRSQYPVLKYEGMNVAAQRP